MAAQHKDTFQELHHGEQEYCRRSGPTNPKAGSFPSAALVNGLELASAALAAVGMIVVIAAFYLSYVPLSILDHSALIQVNIFNRPQYALISYSLSPAADPDTVIAEGALEALGEAKAHHFALEEIYKAAMDFGAAAEIGANIADGIVGAIG